MQAYRLWPAGPITFSETLQTWSGQQHGLELEVCNLQTVLQAYPPYAPSRSPLTSPPGLLQACRVAHIIPHPHQSSLTPSSGPSRRSVTSLRHVPQSCPAAALCRALAPLCRALWPGRPAKLGERGRATRHAGTAPPRRPMEYRNAESLLVSVSFHGPADGAAWSAPANLSTSWSAPANQPTIAVTALPGGRPSMTAWSAPANRAVIAPSAQAADC